MHLPFSALPALISHPLPRAILNRIRSAAVSASTRAVHTDPGAASHTAGQPAQATTTTADLAQTAPVHPTRAAPPANPATQPVPVSSTPSSPRPPPKKRFAYVQYVTDDEYVCMAVLNARRLRLLNITAAADIAVAYAAESALAPLFAARLADFGRSDPYIVFIPVPVSCWLTPQSQVGPPN